MLVRPGRTALMALWLCILLASPAAANWKYFRSGNSQDSNAVPKAGFALMGGGPKQEAAFQFLCERANGGDFLILRANTEDDYAKQVNQEMLDACRLNSAATIVFDDRENSSDPKLLDLIAHAESIFIAGGDQSNYVRFWQDTPVQDALNRHIAAGKPIGGSSAGLAVLGEFSFSSMIDTIHSPEALASPYGNKVTLSRRFLDIPWLHGVITDTHFGKRDRMGRLLVFLARILQDGWAKRVRAIAVEENAAVLVEADGRAKVVGFGPAYFLETGARPSICVDGEPLTFANVAVHKGEVGTTFDLHEWKGQHGTSYSLSVSAGRVTSDAPSHSIY
jgi:cyanophycinase